MFEKSKYKMLLIILLISITLVSCSKEKNEYTNEVLGAIQEINGNSILINTGNNKSPIGDLGYIKIVDDSNISDFKVNDYISVYVSEVAESYPTQSNGIKLTKIEDANDLDIKDFKDYVNDIPVNEGGDLIGGYITKVIDDKSFEAVACDTENIININKALILDNNFEEVDNYKNFLKENQFFKTVRKEDKFDKTNNKYIFTPSIIIFEDDLNVYDINIGNIDEELKDQENYIKLIDIENSDIINIEGQDKDIRNKTILYVYTENDVEEGQDNFLNIKANKIYILD